MQRFILVPMRIRLTVCILLISAFGAFAQNDLLVMKKQNQIVQTWVRGSSITFQFSNKQWLQGIIKAIRNDSLLLDIYVLRQVPNQFGMPTVDTGKIGLLKLHTKEIYAMPKRKQGGSIFTNGALFKIAGGAFIFFNITNSLINGEQVFGPDNLPSLGIAVGLIGVGMILGATHKTEIVLGKKYTLVTINTSN
jgi:hypothetical protein